MTTDNPLSEERLEALAASLQQLLQKWLALRDDEPHEELADLILKKLGETTLEIANHHHEDISISPETRARARAIASLCLGEEPTGRVGAGPRFRFKPGRLRCVWKSCNSRSNQIPFNYLWLEMADGLYLCPEHAWKHAQRILDLQDNEPADGA